MKNSKLLSLLTAAALVVSSFSGLAISGGIARAAGTEIAAATGQVTTFVSNQFISLTNVATDKPTFTVTSGATPVEVLVTTGLTTADDATGIVTIASDAGAGWTAITSGGELAANTTSTFTLTGVAGGKVYVVVYDQPGAAVADDDPLAANYIYFPVYVVTDTVGANGNGTNVTEYSSAVGTAETALVGANPSRQGDYTAGGGTPTGTIRVYTYGTDYNNEQDMPAFDDLFNSKQKAAVGADIAETDADMTISKVGVANTTYNDGVIDVECQLLTYAYSFNVNRAYAVGNITFTFDRNPMMAAFTQDATISYTLTLNAAGLGVPATPGSFTHIAFMEGDGTARTSYTWPVSGVAFYDTDIESESDILRVGALNGNFVAPFNAAGVLTFTGDARLVRNATRTWYLTASSSDESILRVSVNDQSDWLTLTAYGIGEATITLTMEDLNGHAYTTSCVVTTVPADVYVRVYNSKSRDVSYVNLSGDGASEVLTADVRAASYDAPDAVNFVVVTTLANTTASQAEAQHYIASSVDGNKITLNAVGNGSLTLYAYTDIDGTYSRYLKNSPANLDDVGKCINALDRMIADSRGGVRRIPLYSVNVSADVATLTTLDEVLLRTDGVSANLNSITDYWVNEQTVRNYGSGQTASNTAAKVSVASSDEKIATATVNAAGVITITPVAEGNAEVTVSADWKQGSKAVSDTKTIKVNVVTKDSKETDPDKPQPGELVKEDGVTGVVNEDGETVTVTDVTVVSKAITIPETVDGLKVTAVAPQAFKKTNAKTVYVVGSVEELGKGAFKASKVKKVFFYDPAALKTVGKNAFKKTDAKVVGVGAAFSDDAAKQLKKAGASKVKNNGTAK